MKEIVHFKVSSGIKNIVGRELITDDIVAIFELVKNSFDANAKRIDLLISPLRNRVEVRDDGVGMTPDEIKEKWLFIAFSEKTEPTSERIYAGSKGIGRFSCDTLGSKLTLFSRKNGITTSLTIDWDIFESNTKNQVGDLDITLDTSEEDTANLGDAGTLLVIESLRTNWSLQHSKKALDRLKQLLNPIDSVNNTDLYFGYESNNSSDNFLTKVKNDAFDSLSEKTTFVDCGLEGKYLTLNLHSKGHIIFSASYLNPFSIKNIVSKIYFMDLRSKIDFKKKTGIDSVNFGNIFVFKNNFRVYPYGEKDFDIFHLNLRKTQGYNRYLGGRELLGWINIIDKTNLFVEASSRNNGFINGPALNELEIFYMDFIQKTLEKYVAITKFGMMDIDTIIDNDEKKRVVINELTSHLKKYEQYLIHFETFNIPVGEASIKQKIESLMSSDIPQKQKNIISSELNNTINNLRRENEAIKKESERTSDENEKLRRENKQKNLFLVKKKPERQDYMAHELTKASNDINEIIKEIIDNPGDLTPLADLKKVALKLASIKNIVLRTNLDTKSYVEIDLVSFIKECLNMSIYKSKKMEIIFENDDIILMKRVQLFDFNVVIDNLFSNAKDLNASFFKVIFNEDKILFASDTGPVNSEVIENAFNLGFSTKKGTGFGLYLVKNIVAQHGWKIKMVGNDASNYVYFELEFKK